MREETFFAKADKSKYTPNKIGYPLAAERSVNSEARKKQFEARLNQTAEILDPNLRGAVTGVLSEVYGHCGDWRIHITDSYGNTRVLPGRADNPGSLEGRHQPINVNLPSGIKLDQVLPFLK